MYVIGDRLTETHNLPAYFEIKLAQWKKCKVTVKYSMESSQKPGLWEPIITADFNYRYIIFSFHFVAHNADWRIEWLKPIEGNARARKNRMHVNRAEVEFKPACNIIHNRILEVTIRISRCDFPRLIIMCHAQSKARRLQLRRSKIYRLWKLGNGESLRTRKS